MKAGAAVALLLLGLAACGTASSSPGQETTLNYVALGDSYTIGTSVTPDESWPSQLVKRVPRLRLVANLGRDGFNATDVRVQELDPLPALDPQFVTLMIGVNDVVAERPDEIYAAEVGNILDAVLLRVPAKRILCIATPDYTVTPQGSAFGDPAEQSARIEGINTLLNEACEARSVRFVPDIFAISQAAATDPSLVASDGLHPSGAQYKLWVDAIQPVVEELLASPLPSADR
ncbi:MAG: SGNH/GDSL hydrolase family protein [Candidatus Limnocylindria bacterium]